MIPYNKNLKQAARNLRRNMTEAERLLWSRIRRKQVKGYQFYRQKNIGNYIVDFYCPGAKLIIEADGTHHGFSGKQASDEVRDRFMEKLGFTVMRFSNLEILEETDSVIQKIYDFLPDEVLKKISREVLS
jgi:very-short-patch-repair endonuclease